jgi:hypothetical protein
MLTSTGTRLGAFAGLLDEVRVWSVARSATDIGNDRYAQLTSGSGLVARWGLGEGSSTTIADSVGSPATSGTLTNGPVWTASNSLFDATAACNDGLFCTGADTCSGTGANGLRCSINAGDPCTGGGECADACNEATDSCFDAAGTGCTSDGNVCTNDVCDGSGSCGVNNSASCDDAMFCNGADTCSGGGCTVHAGDPCASGGECADVCNEGAGSCFDAAATPCTDDGNVCTNDQCNGMGTCAHPANTASCDDGQFCTVGDVCAGGSCTGAARDCSTSSDQCRTGTCDEGLNQCTGPPKPDGTACDDGNACTSAESCTAGSCGGGGVVVCGACETCDSGAGCQLGPRTGCRASVQTLASKILIKRGSTEAADQVSWRWIKGSATAPDDFGNPVATTNYDLCVFDQGGANLVLHTTAPAAAICAGAPCWKALASGWKYRDSDRSSDGVQKILMRAGSAGAAKAQSRARGVNMPPFALPVAPPVIAQLQASDGACWETTHTGDGISRNDDGQFRARDD